MITISNLPAAHISDSTVNSIQLLTQASNNNSPNTGAVSTSAVIPTIPNQTKPCLISGRISISLRIIGFQVPLLNLLSCGNNSFLDTSSLSSIALLSGYCILAGVQLFSWLSTCRCL